MSQVFGRGANTLARATLVGAGILVVALLLVGGVLVRSPYATGVGVARPQPVPFSHQHHVRDDGIDCRYCHTTVERSSYAGMPSTETCMNCHRQLWSEAPVLEPVRESWRTGEPLQWLRVYDLPDFVYFDHSIHVAKGIGCVSCHGRIDLMPLTWKVTSLQMEWCLACHRDPAAYVRPREHVFDMDWQPGEENQRELGRRLVDAYGITVKTSCSTCHR